MQRTRHQQGHIYREKNWWYIRYRENVKQSDGTVRRIQRAKRLVAVSSAYRSVASVQPLAEAVLAPVNEGTKNDGFTMSLRDFVEQYFIPHVEQNLRPSTLKGYKDVWENHLKARCGHFLIRDFR